MLSDGDASDGDVLIWKEKKKNRKQWDFKVNSSLKNCIFFKSHAITPDRIFSGTLKCIREVTEIPWKKNTIKESKGKIKINLGCIIEILMPRGSVSFFSMSKSPQAWRGSFSIGDRRIPSPLCVQSCGSPEATPWTKFQDQKQWPASCVLVRQGPPGDTSEGAGASRGAGRGGQEPVGHGRRG